MNPDKDLAGARVMMFHSSRSGSTVLDRMLNQHPLVEWCSEVLNDRNHALPRINKLLRGVGLSNVQLSAGFMLKTHLWRAMKPIIGFETQYYQLGCHGIVLADYVETLKRLGFSRFILLRRENVLRQIASGAVARARGAYTYEVGQQEPPFVRVKLDPLAEGNSHFGLPLEERINYHIGCRQELEQLLPDCLRLTYESDIESDPRQGYRVVCEYLGIEVHPAIIRTVRTTPYPMRDIVEDYDEVCHHLAGSVHEWMLED